MSTLKVMYAIGAASLLALTSCATTGKPSAQPSSAETARQQGQLMALETQVAGTSASLERERAQNTALQRTNGQLAKELAAKSAAASQLESQNRQMLVDFDNYRREIGDLSDLIQGLQKDSDAKSAEIALLGRRIAALDAANRALASTLGATKSDLEERVASLSSENTGYIEEIARLSRREAELAAARDREERRMASVADQLRSALAAQIARGEIDIRRYAGVLIVDVKEEVLFNPDSPTLRPQYEPILRTMARIFNKVPEKVIRVEGNTAVALSSPATLRLYPTSWHLGAARAANVVHYLQDDCGVDPLRLVVVSFGQYRPVASNATEAGRVRNRRVQFVLIDRPLYEVSQLEEVASR